MSASAAVAAVPPIRSAVTDAVSEVKQLIFGERRDPTPNEERPADDAGVGADMHPSQPAAGGRLPSKEGSERRPARKRATDRSTAVTDGSSAEDEQELSHDPGAEEPSGSGSSDASSDGSSSDGSSDMSQDSSDGGTDRSSDESSDSWEDEGGSGSSHDESQDCSSESNECWDGTPPDPDDF